MFSDSIPMFACVVWGARLCDEVRDLVYNHNCILCFMVAGAWIGCSCHLSLLRGFKPEQHSKLRKLICALFMRYNPLYEVEYAQATV